MPITNKIGKPTQGAAYAALGKIYVYEENWQEAINVLEPLTQNPYTYKLVEDFNWNFDDTHENNAESIFELLIEDVGGTDLWGDGENINSTQSNTRPKEYAAAEVGGWYEANPTQQIMDIFWKEKTKTAILIIVPAVLWHGTMKDALTTKDLSGKFCTRQVENILDFEISELEDSKR